MPWNYSARYQSSLPSLKGRCYGFLAQKHLHRTQENIVFVKVKAEIGFDLIPWQRSRIDLDLDSIKSSWLLIPWYVRICPYLERMDYSVKYWLTELLVQPTKTTKQYFRTIFWDRFLCISIQFLTARSTRGNVPPRSHARAGSAVV